MARAKKVALWAVLAAIILCSALWLLSRWNQDFGIKAMMSEVILAGSGAREQINEFYAKNKRLPRDAGETQLDLGVGSTYVERIDYDAVRSELRIVARKLGPEVDGKSIVVRAEVRAGNLYWICGSYDMPAQYLPGSCNWKP